MKVRPLGIAIWGIILSVVVAIITSAVSLFGLSVAYILTFMISNLEMRQAIIPGSVLAGFSLYFCFKFFTHTIEERNHSYLCAECGEKGDDNGPDVAEVPRATVLRTARTKHSRARTTHNK